MMDEKGSWFDDEKIKPTSFYSNESEKTKFNWFCYELSLSFYKNINGSLGDRLERVGIDEDDIADFSVHLAKRMKEVALEVLYGDVPTAYFSYEMVEAYFSNIDDELVDAILDVVSKSWDDLLAICERCPTRCISEKDAHCTMFEEGP